MLSKKSWLQIAICSGLFVGLAVVAAFFDLAINKALYNPDSLFGQYFARLGELPAYIATPAVGVILFYQGFGTTKSQTIIYKAVAAALIFMGWLYAVGFWFWEGFIAEDLPFAALYKLTFSLILTVCTILSCAKVDKKLMRKLLVFAFFVAITVALSNFVVQVCKVLWSRQRYRTMVDTPQNAELIATYVRGGDLYQGFTPWYKPAFLFANPIRTPDYVAAYKAVDSAAFKSFPSGHTVAAAATFVLIILPDMFAKLRQYKWIFWTLPAIYTAMVGASRIVMGAHYLSDILFGGFIGFATAALVRWVFVSKLDKIYHKFAITEDYSSSSKIIVLS